MKRFMLFAGNNYYGTGGMCDFVQDFDTVQGAMMVGKDQPKDWWHVFDTVNMKVIAGKKGIYSGRIEDEMIMEGRKLS